jgi:altronate dehydratase small subunit
MAIDAIILNEADNVATAVQEIKAGKSAIVLHGRVLSRFALQENIPYGHKFTVRPVRCGENILQYGKIVGRATADIGPGCHAHVHNIENLLVRRDINK